MSQRRRGGPLAWVVMPVLGLHALVLVVLPTLVLVAYAFADRDDLGDVVASPSTEAARRVFSPVYLGILGTSLGWAGAVTAFCLVIGLPIAWTLAMARPPWDRRLLALVMIPFFTSILVRAYALMTLLAAEGWVAGALGALGVLKGPPELLYTPGAAMLGLVSVYLPMAVLPLHASVAKLDPTLLEAALDLGATPVRAFVHVVLPLLRPGILAAVTLTFVPSIGMFAVVDLLGGGRTPLVGSVIANQLGGARDWPFGAALGVVLVALFVAGSLATRALARGARA